MPHDIEELHRQASAFCIKADFEAALGLWRQMLELRPGDERAIEGIRLCEKLVAGESLAPPPPDPAPEPAAAPLPSSETIEDLDHAIDGARLETGAAPSAMEPAQEGAVASVIPESGPPTGSPLTSEAGPSSKPVDLDASKELRRRLGTLLREASDHLEQGRVDDAEQVLVRVLILDEENQDGLKLQQRIQESRHAAGTAPAAPPAPASAAEVELDLGDEAEVEGQEILPLDVLSPAEPPAEAPPVDDAQAEPAAVEDSDPAAPPADSSAPDSEEASEEEEAAAAEIASKSKKTPKSKTALPAWATDRRVQLGAGGVLLLVAVVFGLGLFGGEEVSPVAEPAETTAAEKPVEAGGGEPQATEEPAAPVVRKDPAVLLQEARAGVEAEDWAAAVVAYNELLRQVPDHPEALEKLPVTMEHYRLQQDRQKKWNETVSAFEAGDFHEALRGFYHMQDGMDVARLNRYKVNGWYNLGVMALQGNRCSAALDHFDEALMIRPGDEGVVAAMALADACLDAGSPSAAVRRLEFRALEG